MTRNKFMTADQAVALIKDGDTVALIGGGGGLVEPTHIFRAVSRRFLATRHPPQPHGAARPRHRRQENPRA